MCPVFPDFQAQSQGAITFKVVPGTKAETPTKEPKVGRVLDVSLCDLGYIY